MNKSTFGQVSRSQFASESQDAESSHKASSGSQQFASEQASLVTAQNNIVDVFEFEPVGFMSKGRW